MSENISEKQSTFFKKLWQIANNYQLETSHKVIKILQLTAENIRTEIGFITTNTEDSHDLIYLYDGLHIGLEENPNFPHDSCEHIFKNQTLFITDIPCEHWAECFLDCHEIIKKVISIPIWLETTLFGHLVFLGFEDKIIEEEDQEVIILLSVWVQQMFIYQKQKQELEKLAWYDKLTNLYNRRAGEQKLTQALKESQVQNSRFAIAICDIDYFKLINDRYGHDVGDQVLQQVAKLLKESLRTGDWVARWGGEEFLIFLHRVDLVQSILALERLRRNIAGKSIATTSGPIEVTVSIGVSPWKDGNTTIDNLLSEADEGLYAAKRAGRNRIIAGQDVQDGALWKTSLLKQALREQRLFPVRQVMVELKTQEVIADESLARLALEDGTVLSAREFLSVAEGIQFNHEVDYQIITQTIQHYLSLDAKKNKHEVNRYHFLNVSSSFLAKRDWVEKLLLSAKYYCLKFNCDHKPWVLSITERQTSRDFSLIKRDIMPLIKAGFQLAIDDFGSGNSSFLYLANLPISFIKIEAWIINNLENIKTRKLLNGIVSLAKSQNIITIAEHVEDIDTVNRLTEIGIDWAQGYFFGAPQTFIYHT